MEQKKKCNIYLSILLKIHVIMMEKYTKNSSKYKK